MGKLIDSLAAREALREIHNAASAEFDAPGTEVTRKHECNGIMEGIREGLRKLEALPDAVPKKADDD